MVSSDAGIELDEAGALVRLVKDFEEEHHPLPDPGPQEMPVYPMEQRHLKQAGLLSIFKSRGYVSGVVNAKRAIGKLDLRQLAEFFKVSANVFI